MTRAILSAVVRACEPFTRNGVHGFRVVLSCGCELEMGKRLVKGENYAHACAGSEKQ